MLKYLFLIFLILIIYLIFKNDLLNRKLKITENINRIDSLNLNGGNLSLNKNLTKKNDLQLNDKQTKNQYKTCCNSFYELSDKYSLTKLNQICDLIPIEIECMRKCLQINEDKRLEFNLEVSDKIDEWIEHRLSFQEVICYKIKKEINLHSAITITNTIPIELSKLDKNRLTKEEVFNLIKAISTNLGLNQLNSFENELLLNDKQTNKFIVNKRGVEILKQVRLISKLLSKENNEKNIKENRNLNNSTIILKNKPIQYFNKFPQLNNQINSNHLITNNQLINKNNHYLNNYHSNNHINQYQTNLHLKNQHHTNQFHTNQHQVNQFHTNQAIQHSINHNNQNLDKQPIYRKKMITDLDVNESKLISSIVKSFNQINNNEISLSTNKPDLIDEIITDSPIDENSRRDILFHFFNKNNNTFGQIDEPVTDSSSTNEYVTINEKNSLSNQINEITTTVTTILESSTEKSIVNDDLEKRENSFYLKSKKNTSNNNKIAPKLISLDNKMLNDYRCIQVNQSSLENLIQNYQKSSDKNINKSIKDENDNLSIDELLKFDKIINKTSAENYIKDHDESNANIENNNKSIDLNEINDISPSNQNINNSINIIRSLNEKDLNNQLIKKNINDKKSVNENNQVKRFFWGSNKNNNLAEEQSNSNLQEGEIQFDKMSSKLITQFSSPAHEEIVNLGNEVLKNHSIDCQQQFTPSISNLLHLNLRIKHESNNYELIRINQLAGQCNQLLVDGGKLNNLIANCKLSNEMNFMINHTFNETESSFKYCLNVDLQKLTKQTDQIEHSESNLISNHVDHLDLNNTELDQLTIAKNQKLNELIDCLNLGKLKYCQTKFIPWFELINDDEAKNILNNKTMKLNELNLFKKNLSSLIDNQKINSANCKDIFLFSNCVKEDLEQLMNLDSRNYKFNNNSDDKKCKLDGLNRNALSMNLSNKILNQLNEQTSSICPKLSDILNLDKNTNKEQIKKYNDNLIRHYRNMYIDLVGDQDCSENSNSFMEFCINVFQNQLRLPYVTFYKNFELQNQFSKTFISNDDILPRICCAQRQLANCFISAANFRCPRDKDRNIRLDSVGELDFCEEINSKTSMSKCRFILSMVDNRSIHSSSSSFYIISNLTLILTMLFLINFFSSR